MSESFPRQHARTRRFTLGAPRAFAIAPDNTRVAFLRSRAGDDPLNCLWVHNLDTNTATVVADPRQLLGDTATGDLPPEERARRERARESGGGIVAYATDVGVTGAVYALDGRLYTTDLETGETAGLPGQAGGFDPRPDPTGANVAYIAGGTLHVTSLAEGDRVIAASDDPNVTYGVADFIAAEEMRRSRGYWWSPSGESLLVCRVDTNNVTPWHIASPIDPAAVPTTVRYPAAGTTNPTVALSIFDLEGESVPVEWDQGGIWEYLVDASWAPRPEPTIVVQTRDQRTMAVMAVQPATGEMTEVYRWTNERWIDIVPGAPSWIGARLLTVEDHDDTRRLVLDGDPLTPDGLQVRSVVQSDPDGILAIVSADPTDQQLVHVSLSGTVTELTSAPGLHSAQTAGEVIVISAASMDHDGWETRVVHAGEDVATIANVSETPLVELNVAFHTYRSRELRTAIVLPHGADRDTPLPVLLDPYGGPHAQRVLRARGAYGVSQWFADQGFAVLVTDGRGTPGRGPAFEHEVWGDLAKPVLEDQIEALDAAANDYVGLDMDRVAIRGWSFGGYLAALAVLRRPDRFHAAVAGAPVTDWRLYDTHYTERYLGHPDLHPEHYARTDLTAEAASLTRPLLLIHGLADDNVVAAHTLKLSQALLEAGRPHQVLPLSGVTHMTPQETVAENLLLLQLAFIKTALGLNANQETP